jgi:protein-S-isoprenylcysteine O-methyltransferase Ste14
MSDLFFRVFFICVFSCLTALRLYFRIRSGLFREPLYSPKEPIGYIVFRSIVGVPLLLAVFLYCFSPGRYAWSYLALPVVLRIPGVVLAVLALLLLAWAHRTLGGNFTTSLAPKNSHSIILSGPYALIRHPMYLAYFLLFIAAFLISENWVIGMTGLTIIGMLMTVRRVREERFLIERFGDTYREYREKTGAFFPRPGK